MDIRLAPMDHLGFKKNNDLGSIQSGISYKVDVSVLVRTRRIEANEVLMIGPRVK